MGIIRKLNDIEQALTISNEAYPLTVLCVLYLRNGPDITRVKEALEALQARHILLRARIIKENNKLCFEEISSPPPIEFTYIERSSDYTCQETVNQVLNISIDSDGILMKCWYIRNQYDDESELIVGFHHSIIDGTTARLILDELMSLISGMPLEKIVKNHSSKHAKQLEVSFFRALGFIGRQLKGEWKYLKKGAKAPIPPSPENTTLQFRLSVEQTRKLTLAAGRKKLSLNSLISAVMTHEVIQRLHLEEKPALGRAICFADLRTIMPHSPPASALGCYTSMIRMDLPLSSNQGIWEMAEGIKKGIFQSNRRGDIQVMTKLSKHLFRMAISMKKMRLGNTALSFIGKLDLKPMYGSVELTDVNAFITNNQFGPELSAFGKIFRGQLGLDFTYLSSELEDGKAREIVMNIQERLEKIANLSEVDLINPKTF